MATMRNKYSRTEAVKCKHLRCDASNIKKELERSVRKKEHFLNSQWMATRSELRVVFLCNNVQLSYKYKSKHICLNSVASLIIQCPDFVRENSLREIYCIATVKTWSLRYNINSLPLYLWEKVSFIFCILRKHNRLIYNVFTSQCL